MPSRFLAEKYPEPPVHWPGSDMWGKLSPEVIARERIEQTPGAITYFIHTRLKRLAIEVTGDPNGYPVILYTGTPGGRIGVKPSADSLPSGVKLITVDRAGYGFSCRQPGRLAADSSYDTQAIVNTLEIDKFGLLSRSGGTGHGLAGSRIKGAESAAVIVPVAPYNLMGESWFDGLGDLNTRIYRALFAEDPENYNPYPTSRRPILSHIPPGDIDQYVEDELDTLRHEVIELESFTDPVRRPHKNDTGARRAYFASHLAALRFGNGGRMDDLKGQRDWGFDLSEVTVPTFLWAAESDQFCPNSHTIAIAQAIGSQIIEMCIEPNTNHHDGIQATLKGIEWNLQHAT